MFHFATSRDYEVARALKEFYKSVRDLPPGMSGSVALVGQSPGLVGIQTRRPSRPEPRRGGGLVGLLKGPGKEVRG
jgi:hypothetical protein